MIESIIKNQSDSIDILELGIGKGGTAFVALEKFPNAIYHGLDISEESVEFCKKSFVNPNISFERKNLLDYTPDKKFDVIISVLTLHHLNREEKISFLKKASGWLKEGGVLVVGDLVKLEDEEMNKKAAGYFSDYRESILNQEEKNSIKKHLVEDKHVFHTIQEMREMFLSAGFKKVDIVRLFYRLAVFRVAKD